MYPFNDAKWNVWIQCYSQFESNIKMLKRWSFGGGSASYLYIISWNSREYEGYRSSHRQDSWMIHRDFPSVLQSSVKFLWVERTHKNVFLVTWRPLSRARDRGGRAGVPNVFPTKRFQNRKVCWNSAKLPLGGKLCITILNNTLAEVPFLDISHCLENNENILINVEVKMESKKGNW